MIPQPNEIYRHFKGNLYKIITLAIHSETGEKMVVYQALYGDYAVYVRPMDMFLSPVDHVKYPDINQEYRFEKMDDILVSQGSKFTSNEGNNEETEDIIKKQEETPVEELVENSENGIDPLIIEFLDADTYWQKSNILTALHHRITNEMVNTLAAALDIVVEEGDIEDRYFQLKNCIQTKEKYECNRI